MKNLNAITLTFPVFTQLAFSQDAKTMGVEGLTVADMRVSLER